MIRRLYWVYKGYPQKSETGFCLHIYGIQPRKKAKSDYQTPYPWDTIPLGNQQSMFEKSTFEGRVVEALHDE